MSASIHQRVFNHPGMIRLVSHDALLRILPEAALSGWLPHCLAEMIHRAWLLRGGGEHSEHFKRAWLEHGFPNELVMAISAWCFQQQNQRSFDLPEAWNANFQPATREILRQLLVSWQNADGMVVFVRTANDAAVNSATALPFEIGMHAREMRAYGKGEKPNGLNLTPAIQRAFAIAAAAKWIREDWQPSLYFNTLIGSCDLLPLEGLSACLPILAALRFRSKGRRLSPLHTAFSGVLGSNGNLEPKDSDPPWETKRNLIHQIGARGILPDVWPVNEPVVTALNGMFTELREKCTSVECIPVPPRVEPKKLHFDTYLKGKRTGFVGRDWLFQKLSSSKSKGLLIIAPQGTGKTSLVAELVQQRMCQQIIAHHCCRSDSEDTREAATFVQSLAAMLADRLPEYDDCLAEPQVMEALSGAKDAAMALSQGIIEPLGRIKAPKGDVRYVVIDALDEAFSVRSSGNAILQLLAKHLDQMPNWLRILATTRDDPRVIESLESWEQVRLDNASNSEDVRNYIEQRLGETVLARLVKENGGSKKTLLAELARRCLGNFLFAKLVLDGLESGLYHLDRLEKLPPDLSFQYKDSLDRAFGGDLAADVRIIFEVMLSARQELRHEELAGATGLGRGAFHNAFTKIRSFLSSGWQEEDSRVGFFHPSFARWLNHEEQRGPNEHTAPEAYQVSRDEGNKRLAEWCARSGQAFEAMPEYSRRHGTYHFVDAGDWTAVTGRLTELRYIECRTKADKVYDLIAEYDYALEKMPSDKFNEQQKGRIKVFRRFVTAEATALSQYAHRDDFVVQQALNHSPDGPVYAAATEMLSEIQTPLLKRRWSESDRALPPSFGLPFPIRWPILDCVVDPTWRLAATLHKAEEGSGSTIAIWNLDTQSLVKELEAKHAIKAIQLLADGQRLRAFCPLGNLSEWEIETGMRGNDVDHPKPRPFHAMAATPDGEWVVFIYLGELSKGESGYDEGTIEALRWHVGGSDAPMSLKYTETFDSPWPSPGEVQISPDGQTALFEGALLDLNALKAHPFHEGESTPIMTADGESAIVNKRSALEKWDVRSGQGFLQKWTLDVPDEIIDILSFSPDDRFVVIEKEDSRFGVWHLASGKCVRLLSRFKKAYFSPDGNRLLLWQVSSSQKHSLTIEHLSETEETGFGIPSDTDAEITAGMSLDGRVAFSGQTYWHRHNGWLGVWDVASASTKRTVFKGMLLVLGGCLMSDGKSVVLKNFEEGFDDCLLRIRSAQDVLGLEACQIMAKITLDGSRRISYGFLVPMPDPNRVRICDVKRIQRSLDSYLSPTSTEPLQIEDLGSWVFDLSSENPCPENWRVSWQGETIPFWGGGGFRWLHTPGEHQKTDQKIYSADGQWLITWDKDKLEIKKWREVKPTIALLIPSRIESVSIDNRLNVIAVESPAGELTFFNTLNMTPSGHLIATACRKLEYNRVLERPVVYPPCCAKEFPLPGPMADTIKKLSHPDQTLGSFDDPALLAECPECGAKLKFNPFFIDIRPFEEE